MPNAASTSGSSSPTAPTTAPSTTTEAPPTRSVARVVRGPGLDAGELQLVDHRAQRVHRVVHVDGPVRLDRGTPHDR